MGSDSADDWYRCNECGDPYRATGIERFQDKIECPTCGGVMEPEPDYRQ